MILLKFFFFLGVQCSETDPGEGRQDKDEGEGKGVAEVNTLFYDNLIIIIQ